MSSAAWHPCPGCGEPASPGSVGCPTCWKALPSEDRERLRAAFRRRKQDPNGYTRAVAEAEYLLQLGRQDGTS